MEEETRAFFVLIANSIAIVLIWMILNVFFGIYMEWGFFADKPTWKNGLYYVLSVSTLFLVIRHLVRKWK